MGEVVKLPRRRGPRIKAASHSMLARAFQSVNGPAAAVIVVLGDDGTFAVRMASVEKLRDFDIYSRAGALCDLHRMKLLE